MSLFNILPYIFTLAFFFYFLEHLIGRFTLRVSRRYSDIIYVLQLNKNVQLRIQLVETLVSAYISLGGIFLAYYHFHYDLNVITGYIPQMQYHAMLMLAYFIYHIIAYYDIRKHMPSMMPYHHILMILFILVILFYNESYFYVLLAGIPSASAVLRNWIWFTKGHDCKICTLTPKTRTLLYIIFQISPIVVCIAHVIYNYNTIPLDKLLLFGPMGIIVSFIAIYVIKNQILDVTQSLSSYIKKEKNVSRK